MRKSFEDRKNTLGISVSNGVIMQVDDYCDRNGISRSLFIETILKIMLRDEDELDRLLDNEVCRYEEN